MINENLIIIIITVIIVVAVAVCVVGCVYSYCDKVKYLLPVLISANNKDSTKYMHCKCYFLTNPGKKTYNRMTKGSKTKYMVVYHNKAHIY